MVEPVKQSKQADRKLLRISSSPHIVSPVTSTLIMGNVLIALAPVTIYGCVIFGFPAVLNVVVSIGAALAGEYLFRRITKQDNRVKDLSAAVTGLMLALVLPPGTPLWMTALGAVFAIVVAKEFFGGLGANVFNPALSGRAFLLMSFPVALTTWNKPEGFATPFVDALTTATPLNIIKQGGSVGDVAAAFGNSSGADYSAILSTLFFGDHAGTIGETSSFLILVSAIYLIATKTIDWRAPVTMLAATALGSFILGLDPVMGVLSGGVLFGAVFMVTDYTTAPLTASGKLVFGAGAGLITVLIRNWGGFPEGVMYSILIMNAFTPFLNRLLPRKYGFVKKVSVKETNSKSKEKSNIKEDASEKGGAQ